MTGRILCDLIEPGQGLSPPREARAGAATLPSPHPPIGPRDTGPAVRASGVILELKMIADVGLIGFPQCREIHPDFENLRGPPPVMPTIRFTTLIPNLEVVDVRTGRSFIVADIPGMIEGPIAAKGWAFSFSSTSSARILVHLIDVSPYSGRDPIEDYWIVGKEIAAFDPALAARPQYIAANKIDLLREEDAGRLAAIELAAAEKCRFFARLGDEERGAGPACPSPGRSRSPAWRRSPPRPGNQGDLRSASRNLPGGPSIPSITAIFRRPRPFDRASNWTACCSLSHSAAQAPFRYGSGRRSPAMVEGAVRGTKGFSASPLEIRSPRTSYSIHTLAKIRKQMPAARLFSSWEPTPLARSRPGGNGAACSANAFSSSRPGREPASGRPRAVLMPEYAVRMAAVRKTGYRGSPPGRPIDFFSLGSRPWRYPPRTSVGGSEKDGRSRALVPAGVAALIRSGNLYRGQKNDQTEKNISQSRRGGENRKINAEAAAARPESGDRSDP